MERLTKRNKKGYLLFKEKLVYAGDFYEMTSALEKYEDTGLTPEQIREMDKAFSAQARELAEYKKVEKQGLLLRLPCKVGDTIYELIVDDIPECKAYVESNTVEDISVKAIKYASDWIDRDWTLENTFFSKEEAEKALEEMDNEMS